MLPLLEIAQTASWMNPELLQLSRLPMHSTFWSLENASRALELSYFAVPDQSSPWVKSLDGTWDIAVYSNPQAVPPEVLEDLLPTGFSSIPVPSNIQFFGHDTPWYTNVQMPFLHEPPFAPEDNPTAVYRRQFSTPLEWQNRRVVLHFGAAESILFVYLNGQPVGMSKDSRLPAEFDISGQLRFDKPNILVAVVIK